LPRLPAFLDFPNFAQGFWHGILIKRSGLRAPKNPSTKEEVIMKLSQAITNFMEYQRINSGKKYGQELPAFPGQSEFPFRRQ
jgi:hypothetical protein